MGREVIKAVTAEKSDKKCDSGPEGPRVFSKKS